MRIVAANSAAPTMARNRNVCNAVLRFGPTHRRRNEAYRPTFHVHNLCRVFPDVSLSLYQPLLTARTRAPVTIKIAFHEKLYMDAVVRLKEQIPLALSGDLALSSVLRAYRSYLVENFWREHLLLEDMICYAVWVGQIDVAARLVRTSIECLEQWSSENLGRIGGIELWRSRWTELLGGRDALAITCMEQIESLQVDRLPVANLTA